MTSIYATRTADLRRFLSGFVRQRFPLLPKKLLFPSALGDKRGIVEPVTDPGGGPRGPWPPPLSQIRTISYAPLGTF